MNIPAETGDMGVLTMAKRLSSAAVGVVFTVVVIFFSTVNPILLDICVAGICACSVFEIFGAVNVKRAYYLVIPSVLLAIALPLTIATAYWIAVWFLYTVLLFGIMIWKKDVYEFKEVAVIYGMTVLVTFSLSTLSLLNKLDDKVGCFFVVFVLIVAWLADSGAFFVGRYFGKHKLAPSISPKKTKEGALGGVISSVIVSILVSLLFEKVFFSPSLYVNYICVTIFALLGSLLSILGDLCFSYLKRNCNIKDFGNVLPGHGGILDRFDSVIFVAPFIYSLSLMIPWATSIN